MLRIKDLHYGTLKAFHSKNLDFRKVEKDREHNDAIITRLFNDTLSGKIKGFYLVSNESFKAYHRSPKKPGYIQYSVGFYKHGELYPTYDVQLKTAADAIKEGYNSGLYEIIA